MPLSPERLWLEARIRARNPKRAVLAELTDQELGLALIADEAESLEEFMAAAGIEVTPDPKAIAEHNSKAVAALKKEGFKVILADKQSDPNCTFHLTCGKCGCTAPNGTGRDWPRVPVAGIGSVPLCLACAKEVTKTNEPKGKSE